MGIDMFPWQIEAINGMLEVDENWRLRHRFALVSVGRQNGKTKGLLAPLIGWWLTHYAAQRGEPQNVMSTAHKLDVAEDVANVLFPILEEKFGFQTYRSFGRKEAFHEGGSRWRVVSSGESAGHGTSNDLVVVDEIWNVKPEVIEGGLLPTQTARPAPFAFFTSTAGSEDSKFFIRWRERGMQQIEAGEAGRLYMAEWSPPANVDPTERRWWSWANPSLGYTITEQELADKLEALDRGEFVRHHCNMWTSSIGSWLPHGAWEALQVDDPMPAGGILAVDSNATDMRYVGVRVALREDGRYQADTEFAVETQDEMWAAITESMKDRSVELALTPGLATMCPLDLSRRMTIWGYQEINRYTAIVKGMILEGRMAHNGKMTLTEQVNRAVAGRTQASITLTSQKSPGPIEQCRCMVAAAGMAAKPQSNIRKPMIGSSR
jgi:hypothetical protein